MGGIDQSVSPGFTGFVVTACLTLALWLLMRNMNTRLRNVRYREDTERAQAAMEVRPPHAEGVGTPTPGVGTRAAPAASPPPAAGAQEQATPGSCGGGAAFGPASGHGTPPER